MIEYLIVVALIAVAAISVMRVLGQNIAAQYGTIANSLQGNSQQKIETDKVTEPMTRKKDLANFFEGAARDKN